MFVHCEYHPSSIRLFAFLGCTCEDYFPLPAGSGNCRRRDNGADIYCFVKEPTSCRDAITLSDFPNTKISRDACKAGK